MIDLNHLTGNEAPALSPVRKMPLRPVTYHPTDQPPLVTGIERWWVILRVTLCYIRVALQCYGNPLRAWKALKAFRQFKKRLYGHGRIQRFTKTDDRYFFNYYVPGFPSEAFDRFVRTELHHLVPHHRPVNRFQLVHLAITGKCPLKCAHCYEWENLNRQETFSAAQLKQLMQLLGEAGCGSWHLSGGEPLVRMNLLAGLVAGYGRHDDIYVLTSGVNLTAENARRLKNCGVTGVAVSLDHYDPMIHNLFRGSPHAYQQAIDGLYHARQAGLVTALSICLTRSFTSRANLEIYARLARDCGVSFVQLLEPRAVGHYKGEEIALLPEQVKVVADFFLEVNTDERFRDHPVFQYYGLYQRRGFCATGGNRGLYIDSAGFINACPFCHTHQYRAADLLDGSLKLKELKIAACPAFVDRTATQA